MATKKEPVIEEEIPVEQGEQMVTIRLPIIKGDERPVYVRVNERTWGIPRGVTVTVPKCVQEVLRLSEDAQLAAYAYSNAHQRGE